MTVYNREFNRRLTRLERCAETAPEGMYKEARDAVAVINDISGFVLSRVRDGGFKVNNDDRLRDLEAAIYQYMVEANPMAFGVAEGFGEHIDGPAGQRVYAQAVRDSEAMKALQSVRGYLVEQLDWLEDDKRAKAQLAKVDAALDAAGLPKE